MDSQIYQFSKKIVDPVCLPPFSLYYFLGPMGDIISRVSFALVNRRENVNFMYGECILMAFLSVEVILYISNRSSF